MFLFWTCQSIFEKQGRKNKVILTRIRSHDLISHAFLPAMFMVPTKIYNSRMYTFFTVQNLFVPRVLHANQWIPGQVAQVSHWLI